jgi:hypothetical protein
VHSYFIGFKTYPIFEIGGEVLCNTAIESGICNRLVRLIKMCMHEMSSGVRTGKHLSDTFPIHILIKERVIFSPLRFNFTMG